MSVHRECVLEHTWREKGSSCFFNVCACTMESQRERRHRARTHTHPVEKKEEKKNSRGTETSNPYRYGLQRIGLAALINIRFLKYLSPHTDSSPSTSGRGELTTPRSTRGFAPSARRLPPKKLDTPFVFLTWNPYVRMCLSFSLSLALSAIIPLPPGVATQPLGNLFLSLSLLSSCRVCVRAPNTHIYEKLLSPVIHWNFKEIGGHSMHTFSVPCVRVCACAREYIIYMRTHIIPLRYIH